MNDGKIYNATGSGLLKRDGHLQDPYRTAHATGATGICKLHNARGAWPSLPRGVRASNVIQHTRERALRVDFHAFHEYGGGSCKLWS